MTLPTTVCGYQILAELGRGATGIVYQARHPVVRPDRLVALKMPSLGSAMEAAGRLASFHNEWNALRILTWTPDPVIPTLLNVGSDLAGRNHHYVRDFVDGSTLEQLVANRALGLREAIHILSVIASAVQRMHGLKIAHRNLRPDRIFCAERWLA